MTKKQLKEAEEALETILKRDKEMVAMACKTALVLKVYSSIALEAQSDIDIALKHIPPTSTARRHLLSAMTKLSKIV